MDRITKIATCCYCGARSTLVLDRERRELACPSCAAPLHNLKQVKVDRKPAKPSPKPAKAKYEAKSDKRPKYDKPKKKHKKRKPLWYKALEEVIDLID
jgi:hypothetical protein